jgi:DNA replication protein DnaC
MSRYVTIGLDANSNKEITIGDIEWRSGFYILGRSGMGKTNLIVNLIKQAIIPFDITCFTMVDL